ncbi:MULTISPECIES: cytochrome b [unclassified Sphingomonas]|jgi:cytochrome b561|uniref:cytochrome b n=1 Tax=unclassified Sphingomonas TaxID=196159 RepID=UPI000E104DC3|nr:MULTISPECIES: cytochrome b [unclassified Sphingomonas]AXJ95655.1 cytochrome b [Sphingomonas sp. FARSPH]
MSRLPRDERYSTVAIWFHWGIAVLIIANLVIGIGHDSVPALRALMGAHFAIGLTVLALTVLRVAWRLGHRAPPYPAAMPAWEKGVAHANQWGLYLLMLALPLTGWLMVSGPGPSRPMTWFGLFIMPHLPASKAAAGFGHEAHGILGWAMVALVVLHVAAALRHHFVRRDQILSRMAPIFERG